MKDYRITYVTNEGDSCKVWLSAESKEEAESEARQEYWDIEEIISVSEM